MLFAVSQAMPVVVVSPLIREVGITELEYGATFSLASVVLIFSAPFWGRKSDELGRKPIILVGLIGAAVGTLAIVITLEAGVRGVVTGYALLLTLGLSRFLYACLASAIYPSGSGYIADVTTRAQRAQGMALMGAANGMGSVLGPLLVATLAFVGVLFPMYVAAALTMFGALLVYLRLPEPVDHASRGINNDMKFTDPRLRPYMLVWGALFMVFMALQFVSAFFIQDRFGIDDPEQIARTLGWVLFAMAFMIMFTQGVILQAFRISPRVLFKVCVPLFLISMLIVGFSQEVWQMGLGFAVLGLGFSCAAPGINGSASLSVQPHEQGAAAGYLAASNTAGGIVGPVVGTAMYKLGPSAPMLAGAALLLVVALFAFTVKTPEV